MAKRAPDSLNSFRIELQEKERELFEQYMYMSTASNIIDSLTSMSWEQMYAWITIFEAFGLTKTPIPTISDASEIAGAISSWAKNGKARREKEQAENPSTRPDWVQKSDNFLYDLFYSITGAN